MGKIIESIAVDRGHEIALVVDINNYEEFTTEWLNGIDVASSMTPSPGRSDLLADVQ